MRADCSAVSRERVAAANTHLIRPRFARPPSPPTGKAFAAAKTYSAFSSAVSSTVYALLLLLPMQRRGEGVLDRTMGLDLVKMLLAAAVTGLAAAGVLSLLTGVLPGGKIGELLSLGGCALVGLIVYFVLTLALAVPEAKLVVSLARGKHE